MNNLSAILTDSGLKVVVNKDFYTLPKGDSRIKDVLNCVKDFHTFVSSENKAEIVNQILAMFQPARKFLNLTEGTFEIKDSELFHVEFPEIPVPESLHQTILLYVENEFPIAALENFWKKLAQNPNVNSREQFYAWLERNEITIDQEGDAIMYKAVRPYQHAHQIVSFGEPGWKIDGQGVITDKDGNPVLNVVFRQETCEVEYVDIHSETFNNTPGMRVSIDRGLCDPDTDRHCSTGLHCSTLKYARGFGKPDDVIVAVKVNPANVVSVPNDGFEKIRVCEYLVLGVLETIQYDGEKRDSLPGYVNLEIPVGDEQLGNKQSDENPFSVDDNVYVTADIRGFQNPPYSVIEVEEGIEGHVKLLNDYNLEVWLPWEDVEFHNETQDDDPEY